MSQQFPPPGQPQQPGWGHPPQPPQPKKTSTGKIVGLSCLGVVGMLVLIGIAGAVVGGGASTDPSTEAAKPPAVAPSEPAQVPEAAPSSAAPEKKAAVTVVAKQAAYKKSIIAPDGDYTSVSVTVTNNSSKPIGVNPLYFTITDTSGGKHVAELAADEDQIATVELAPGENVTGTVTGKGAFTPKTVTYTDGLIGKSVRADVS
ncbi:DUF4352 domain-containing protein [Streptomyces sp. enrichment culture]|uniref:DUF4352 domain-containing protein n=1 Tax=Streptomyces sp. enrichment culture TaxID=1795815 RepID=UPI003F54BD4B